RVDLGGDAQTDQTAARVRGSDRRRGEAGVRPAAASGAPVGERELHQLLPATGERREQQDQHTLVQGSHWRLPSFRTMKWTTNSTRRLASRPTAVALDSMGRDELKPLETSLSRATP